MPRARRVERPGGLHHVTAKVVAGRTLFPSEEETRLYLQLVGELRRDFDWSILTYCLMGNHVHWLVRTPRANLGRGIKQAHERYATAVNHDAGATGHLFRERFFSKLVESSRHAGHTMRYIAHNPVKAGLCETPDAWRWSAHAALVGQVEAPRWLDRDAAYAVFGDSGSAGKTAYEEVVRSAAFDPEVMARTYAATATDDRWLVEAVDELEVPIAKLMEILGCGRSTFYARLKDARAAVAGRR